MLAPMVPNPPTPSSAARVVLEGKDSSHVITVERGQRKSIGRRADAADIALPETILSRRHFVIDFTGDHAFIEDASSASGTYLDQARITREPLLGGAIVEAGRLAFTVRYEG
jgi:pSer/pThr/pTyr-binding forkhead associated (FHA) protein